MSALGYVYYTDSDPSDAYTIVGQGATVGLFNGGGWQLAIAGGSLLNPNTLFAYIGTGSGNPTQLYSTATLTQNTWYFVAVTYDGTTWRLYVNAVLQPNTSTTNNQAQGAIYLGAASAGDATYHLDGRESYIAVVNRAVSASELAGIYDAGL